MKKLFKFTFTAYHLLFPSTLRVCRFEPTCSKYLLEAIEKYGPIRGLRLGMSRILSCHQFSKRPIYDPA